MYVGDLNVPVCYLCRGNLRELFDTQFKNSACEFTIFPSYNSNQYPLNAYRTSTLQENLYSPPKKVARNG